jgi:hypothetical protein
MLQSILGEPAGTSKTFLNMMAQAPDEFQARLGT